MSSVHGIYKWSARLNVRQAGHLSSQALRGYGPDREFDHASGDVLLGGNLSAFLPEDRFDSQPCQTEANEWIVADLRLDNRDELAAQLSLTSPQTLADSTVLALAWQRWGAGCLEHLVGVFAFAVWNPRRRELFIARDHTGERPLFFHRGDGFFAFASMPKGLLAIPGVNQGVDEETLLHALTLSKYSQAVSFFKGIERVPPGHFVRVSPGPDSRGKVEVAAYWRPFELPTLCYKRDEDYAEHFLEVFDHAVAARLRTTGKIGSMLSAGLDSSSVTVSAARQLARRGERLTAFTAVPRPGFHGKGFHGRLPDEGPGARDVASLYPNIDHVLLDSAGEDMLETVTKLSDAVDEPVQNGVNSLWIAAILNACRERGLSTLLVGIRGNLTISHAGMEALAGMLRRGRWLRLARTAHSFRQRGLVSFRRSFAEASIGLLPDALHRRLLGGGSFDLTYSAVNPSLSGQHQLRERMLGEFFWNQYDPRRERLDLWQIYDLDTYQAGYQAVHGIDVRDPCIDRRVLECCFAMPSEQYVAGGVPRSLVRRAMRGRLPEATLTRTRRGQQGADWYLTMRDALPSLREQMALNEQSPTAQRLLDLTRMRTLLKTFPENSLDEMNVSLAWGDALCRGFSFGYFMRRHERPAVAEKAGAEDAVPVLSGSADVDSPARPTP